MSVDEARKWLIVSCLTITGIQLVFLLVAPAIGVPLVYPKNLDLLQILTPVFLGYLGSAVHFVFMHPRPTVQADNEYLSLLVKGPIIIYSCAQVAAFGAFWYSNRENAPIGSGMSSDSLATAMSILLGVLAATTAVLISYLFAVAPQNSTIVETEKKD